MYPSDGNLKREVNIDSPFTDESRMPSGNWIGQPLRNVPAWHLLWLYDQDWIQKPKNANNRKLKAYIEENYDALVKQKADGIE